MHHLLGMQRFFRGGWDDAAAEFEAGLGIADELGSDWHSGLAHTFLARIALHRDQEDELTAHLQRLDELAEGGLTAHETIWLAGVRGQVEERRGSLDDAAARYGEMWTLIDTAGAHSFARWFGAEYVRFLVSAGDPEAAAHVATVVEAVAVRAPVPSAQGAALRSRGLADGDGGALKAAVEAYRTAGRPLDLALVCEDAGVARKDGEGVSLLREARDLFEALGAEGDVKRVAARLRDLGVREGARGRRGRPQTGWESLTPTEQRVLDLVCEGLTNRRVAERLYISPRTVDTHVGHIFQKLGVSSRTELMARAATRLA